MQGREKLEYWKRTIEDWQDSGCSQKKFCIQKQISYSTFLYWRHKELDRTQAEYLQDSIRAIEVSPVLKCTRYPISMELESHGIVIAVEGTDATVTVNGRINLERLERIMVSCGSANDGNPCHAQD